MLILPERGGEVGGRDRVSLGLRGDGAHGAAETHYIGVLFTRATHGPPTRAELASPGGYAAHVLRNTAAAMEALLVGVAESVEAGEIAPRGIAEVRMPRVNSGLFGVEWEGTEGVLKGLKVPSGEGVEVLRRVFVYDGVVDDTGR